MKKSYVATNLGQYLNEQKSITLTRKYGEKKPVVVGSRAPLRNQVLSYVAENQKVSRIKLKKFIAGLNEDSKNPNAAANMWLKRNMKFFVAEQKQGITVYKLSKLGEKLLERMTALAEAKINEKDNKDKDYDFKVNGKKGIHDEKEVNEEEDGEEEEVEEKCNESREERIKKIVEQIKAKRAKRLYEEDEIEAPDEDDDDEKEEKDDDSEEDLDLPDFDDEEGDEESDEGEEETEVEDDDKVEVTEFIISVDDVQSAIEELGELGIEAEEIADEVGGDEEMELDDIEAPEEGGDEEVDDFDLDLGGDIEGEEEDVSGEEEEMEESITGMEGYQKKRNDKYGKSPANLTEEEDDEEMEESSVSGMEKHVDDTENLLEDDDELDMGDLDLEMGDEEGEGEEAPEETPEEGGEDEFDMEETPEDESQIRVSAENWPQLKKWLEEKGVDIEEMFGGQIEMEGEDVEDEISFDDLEDTGEEKGGEKPEKDDADDDDDDEEDEEVDTEEEEEDKE